MGKALGTAKRVANKAKEKKGTGEENNFMEAVQKNMKAKEATKKDVDESGEQYTDMKAGLKKAAVKPKEEPKKNDGEGGGDQYLNMKAGLKKASASKAPASPSR